MTDKEFVHIYCPKAWAYRCGRGKYEVADVDHNGSYAIGEGRTESDAWYNAAFKLGKYSQDKKGKPGATSMTTETERARFEKWASVETDCDLTFGKIEKGVYDSLVTEWLWQAWQAALRSREE